LNAKGTRRIGYLTFAGTGQKAIEINDADVAELVDARDLKFPGATEIAHFSDLTRAGNPHEAGGRPGRIV
jgi:hypothetical protein